MSFTAFLFTVIIILVLGFSLNSILNSRTFRIWLITQRDHLHQKEIEKEMQKSRQRSIEEIKNPDRVMEVIMKIKRGEEVKIPLAAFDYIYRNMKNFSIVDKDGRISIINQEDYFRFKKGALALLEKDKSEKIDVKQILSDIERRVAENPIEVTKHDDGTVVKVDHVSRTAEITKPNGEMILIDHKTDTMVSQNLIEQPDQKSNKKEIVLKDAQIKKTNEENMLLRGKIQKLRHRNEGNIRTNVGNVKNYENNADMDELINSNEDENLLLNYKNEHLEETKNVQLESNFIEKDETVLTELGIRKRINFKAIDTHVQRENTKIELDSDTTIGSDSTSDNALLDFQSLEPFLSSAITFKNIFDFTKNLILCDLSTNDLRRINDVLKTYIVDSKSFECSTNADRTHNERLNNTQLEINHHTTLSGTSKYRIGVVYDEKSSCFLVNINWLFLKLSALLQSESIRALLNAFYSDQKKSFVNNETLTCMLAHINTKSSLSIGSKIFMQEKNEKTTINFRTVKIKVEQEVYQGQYLYLFTASNFCKSLVQEYEAKMENTDFEIDNDLSQKGEKITLFTLL